MTETTISEIEIPMINKILMDVFSDDDSGIVDRIYTMEPQHYKLTYPCILVKSKRPNFSFADNTKYTYRKKFEVMLIDTIPDSPRIEAILKGITLSTFVTSYVSSRLYHTILEVFI